MSAFIGFKKKSEYTVIQGSIEEVVEEFGGYIVYFEKYNHTRPVSGSDFDDIGNRKISDLYHYNRKGN